MMTLRWHEYFLHMAILSAGMSKDPNTRVGAVIVDRDKLVRATGYNGFPRGVADSSQRLLDREAKNALMVHAEHNAILSAARAGVAVKGCILYLCAIDGESVPGNNRVAPWGGPPCLPCALACIQAGIEKIVSLPFKEGPSAWRDSIESARHVLREAGVSYIELPTGLEP